MPDKHYCLLGQKKKDREKERRNARVLYFPSCHAMLMILQSYEDNTTDEQTRMTKALISSQNTRMKRTTRAAVHLKLFKFNPIHPCNLLFRRTKRGGGEKNICNRHEVSCKLNKFIYFHHRRYPCKVFFFGETSKTMSINITDQHLFIK